jgi:predicted dehydrogenase
MKNGKIFNWGIIGCGHIAEKFAESLQILPNANLKGVASKSEKRAKQFADNFKVPYAFDSYDNLVHRNDIDVVYIATTHNFHFENAKLCLNNGKAVLCEKPLTVNAEETGKLIEMSRKNNIFLMEAFWTRFLPSTKKLMTLLADKIIGEVRMIKADFGYNFPFEPESRVFNPALAGGALLDVGIYPINFAQMIYRSEPEEVCSTASMSTTGIDEQSAYLLKYKNGEMALLHSAVNVETRHDAWIYGTDGYIHVPKFYCADRVYVAAASSGKTETILLPYESTGYGYEALEVMKCISDGRIESEIMPHVESLKIMKLMDRMRKSWGMKYPGETA